MPFLYNLYNFNCGHCIFKKIKSKKKTINKCKVTIMQKKHITYKNNKYISFLYLFLEKETFEKKTKKKY